MIDLTIPGAAKQLASRIRTDIDKFAISKFDDGHRNHLGASRIGEECSRRIYSEFRWIAREEFSGRMLRLFNRGHREEAHFIGLLKGIGFDVIEHDKETGEQIRVKAVDGHAGGSCDGVAWAPADYGLDKPLLLEFKTQGTGGGFNELVAKGCAVVKPVHYAQMNIYGRLLGLSHCLYMVANKNDDDLHIEIVKLNPAYGDEMLRKMETIVYAKQPPERISENPTFWVCKTCPASDWCHNDKPPEKNCRSCIRSEPRANKEWFCTYWNETIPAEAIKNGCDNWSAIK